MILARVVGNLTATQKQSSHHAQKILVLQPLTLAGEPMGDRVVALDSVSAGVGDCVLVIQEGYSAMTAVGHVNSPIDAAVIGIVDQVEFE